MLFSSFFTSQCLEKCCDVFRLAVATDNLVQVRWYIIIWSFCFLHRRCTRSANVLQRGSFRTRRWCVNFVWFIMVLLITIISPREIWTHKIRRYSDRKNMQQVQSTANDDSYRTALRVYVCMGKCRLFCGYIFCDDIISSEFWTTQYCYYMYASQWTCARRIYTLHRKTTDDSCYE